MSTRDPNQYTKPEKISTDEARRVASNAEAIRKAQQFVQRGVTSGLVSFRRTFTKPVAKPAVDWCVKCGTYHKTEKVCR